MESAWSDFQQMQNHDAHEGERYDGFREERDKKLITKPLWLVSQMLKFWKPDFIYAYQDAAEV